MRCLNNVVPAADHRLVQEYTDLVQRNANLVECSHVPSLLNISLLSKLQMPVRRDPCLILLSQLAVVKF